jgi:N-hydroxyarylamine O-acetyltransferase
LRWRPPLPPPDAAPSADEPAPFDLEAYLGRTGYRGPLAPTVEALRGLHLAHATHIPFENLDILLGRPIRLDLDALQAKLVRGGRGGYCFEQNTLFAEVLARVGFRVTRLAARVRWGATRVLPRTHMLLEVEAEGAAWLADVGFGGEGLLEPLPLAAGHRLPQYDCTYRLTEEAGLWVLQSHKADGWLDLYAFTREPHYPVDFEVANHFTATHPSSIFVRNITVQLPTPEARHILRGRELTVQRGAALDRRQVEGDEELLGVLAETFGLHFSLDTRFRSRNIAPAPEELGRTTPG